MSSEEIEFGFGFYEGRAREGRFIAPEWKRRKRRRNCSQLMESMQFMSLPHQQDLSHRYYSKSKLEGMQLFECTACNATLVPGRYNILSTDLLKSICCGWKDYKI